MNISHLSICGGLSPEVTPAALHSHHADSESYENVYLTVFLRLKPFRWFPIWSRQDSDVTTALTQFSCCSPSLSGIQTHCFLLIQQTQLIPAHLRAFAHAVPASWNASPFINSFISLPYKNLYSSSRRSQSLFWALLAHAPPTYLQGATLRLWIMLNNAFLLYLTVSFVRAGTSLPIILFPATHTLPGKN